MGDGRYRATIGAEWVLAMVAAGRGDRRDRRPGDGHRARHRPAAAVDPRRVRQPGAGRCRRRRRDGPAPRPLDVPGPGHRDAARCRRRLHRARRVRRRSTGLRVHRAGLPRRAGPRDCPSVRDPPPPEAGLPSSTTRGPFWDEVLEGRTGAWAMRRGKTPHPAAAEVASWFRFDHPPDRRRRAAGSARTVGPGRRDAERRVQPLGRTRRALVRARAST